MNVTPQASGIGGVFSGFTRLCKGLATILVTGYVILQIFPFTVDFVALVPGKTIPFVWNLFTAGYLEQSIFGLVVSVLGLLFSGKLIEPVWGSREFLKFIMAVNLLTSMCTFAVAIILYYISQNENYLYTRLSGFHGVLAGFLVAVKQLMPDQEITALLVLKLRAKWLPSILVAVSTIVGIFAKDSMTFFPFILFGTYTSWLYLRFHQRQSEVNLRGDLSDEFSFVTFFPEFLRPLVRPICLICEKLLCGRALRLDDPRQGHLLGGTPLPGSDPVEASRRRERGARALEERLSATAKAETELVIDKSGKPSVTTGGIGAEDNV